MKNLSEAFKALDIAEENLAHAKMDGDHLAISQFEMEIESINAQIDGW